MSRLGKAFPKDPSGGGAKRSLTFSFEVHGTFALQPDQNLIMLLRDVIADNRETASEPRLRPNENLAYSISDVCAKFPISRSTLYQEIKSGALVARKLAGRRTVIFQSDLDTWL